MPEEFEERHGHHILFGPGELIDRRPDARGDGLARITPTRDGSGKVVARVPTEVPRHLS